VSWKASLLGAVLVVAAGLAVGVAIGGKTATRTLTVTVVRKVKVPAPAPTTTSAAATTPTPTTTTATTPTNASSSKTTSPSGNSDEEYLADYLESQGGAEALNHNSENASMDTTPTQRELEGQTYPHAVAFDLNDQGGGNPELTASYQIPTPGFTELTSNAVGLQISSNASTVYHLTVYKNEDSSPNSIVLYQANFRGPSTVHKMSIAIQGATDLLFVWTHKTSEPEEGSTFVLADPVLTGSS
jgi:hypothetical protein